HGFFSHIHDLGPENLGDRSNILSLFRHHFDLDQHQLPVDALARFEHLDVAHIHQLGQLFCNLLQHQIVPAAYHGHPGNLRIGGDACRDTVDIVASAAEQSGHTAEYA